MLVTLHYVQHYVQIQVVSSKGVFSRRAWQLSALHGRSLALGGDCWLHHRRLLSLWHFIRIPMDENERQIYRSLFGRMHQVIPGTLIQLLHT